MNHAYCKCINSDKGGTGESPKIVASIKWAKSWAKLVVTPAPNLQNFILQKQVLASGDVASGCRVKRVANDGYSYFFAKKCTSKRGLAIFIQNCDGII